MPAGGGAVCPVEGLLGTAWFWLRLFACDMMPAAMGMEGRRLWLQLPPFAGVEVDLE